MFRSSLPSSTCRVDVSGAALRRNSGPFFFLFPSMDDTSTEESSFVEYPVTTRTPSMDQSLRPSSRLLSITEPYWYESSRFKECEYSSDSFFIVAVVLAGEGRNPVRPAFFLFLESTSLSSEEESSDSKLLCDSLRFCICRKKTTAKITEPQPAITATRATTPVLTPLLPPETAAEFPAATSSGVVTDEAATAARTGSLDVRSFWERV